VKGGLLGADYSLENAATVCKVYDGENWNPGLAGAIDAAGVNVKRTIFFGERTRTCTLRHITVLRGDCRKQVVLKVGPMLMLKTRATSRGLSKGGEFASLAWIEDNSAKWTKPQEAAWPTFSPQHPGAGIQLQSIFFSQVGKERHHRRTLQ